MKSNVPTISSVKPYTPLELHGRDIYVREGCYTCHSQMVRPFRSETERYGEYAKAGEFVYDHPFQWGSKRTGPDLLRVGGKYPHSWHYYHMYDPTSMSPGSLMPAYPHLFENALGHHHHQAKDRGDAHHGCALCGGLPSKGQCRSRQHRVEAIVDRAEEGWYRGRRRSGDHRSDRLLATCRYGHQGQDH